MKFGYPFITRTHRLWERAAFGYSDDGRQAKALHWIIDGDDEGDDDDDGYECGRHEYGGKQYGGINSCIVFYVGTG